MAYIEMKNSYKRYHVGDTEIIANNDVNFEIEKGEFQLLMKNNTLTIEEMMLVLSSNFII